MKVVITENGYITIFFFNKLYKVTPKHSRSQNYLIQMHYDTLDSIRNLAIDSTYTATCSYKYTAQ